MHDGKRSVIHLLDGQQLELIIQPRLVVHELLNIIASHVALKDADKQYFGLAYVDHLEQYHWLPTDRRVLEYEIPRKSHQLHAVLELHHSVKFFVDSVLTLCHPSAVELYFLETAKRLVKGLLEFTDLEYYKIASSFLQIYCGNYVRFRIKMTVYESAIDPVIFSDEKARCALAELIPIPSGILHTYDISLGDVEKNVIELYKDLSGVPKGVAILNFLQTAERSSTHGCHFYQVRDKAGQPWTVGISNKGIFQYDPADISKPKKIFNWSLLDNLYYRDRKFSIEVRNTRVIQSSGNANSILDSTGCLDSDDELAKAVRDPTTQVSISRRSIASSAVQVHAFYCDTNFLCKTIWSTAISLHQFYLDQRTCISAKRIVSNDPGVELKQLGEKLCRLISHSSVASSLPSLNSLLSNSMPSAKVSDGSLVSLSSLNDIQNREKTQEEKQKEVELYRQLKKRKNELEEKLLAKLDELREVCIKEAEITGELPKEIYKTLMPGEEEPKVKRRVGTAFSLSEEVFKRPIDSNDRISMLEADVELHRKIVAAAERLAKDKTTNKSVRKKRQKDLIAATQKLRGLEFGLTQLRLSASKPDVSSSTRNVSGSKGPWRNCSDYQIESTSLGTRNDSNSLITKSCPATPRGSFPDLLTSTENERSEADDDDYDDDGKRRASTECVQRYPSTSTCSSIHSAHHLNNNNAFLTTVAECGLSLGNPSFDSRTSKREPPPLPHQTCYFLPEREISWEKLKNRSAENHHTPVYENVGYKSCVSYKSSYREMNYPTLNDHTNCKDRVQRAFSDHDLPEQGSVTTKNRDKYESRINYAVGCSGSSRNITTYGTALKQPSWKFHFGQENSRDLCTIGAGTGSSDTSRQAVIQHQQQHDETPSSSCLGSKVMNSSLETYRQSSSSCCNSPPVTGLLLNDGKTPLRYAVLPTSRSYNDGFATASLDRRAMKERQSSCSSMGYHQLRSTQLAVNDTVREICIGQPVTRHSPLSTSRFTTTFPVSGPASVEKSKPLVSADIHYYQQRSPLQQRNSPERSVTSPRNVVQIAGSSSSLRPPPPAYPVAVRNGIFGARSPLGEAITVPTEPRMDALKNYYKDKVNGRKKNATAV
ncbi:GRP1 binding protein [Loa loa]|nr:GRP1 binding protein [Loa loa]EFO20039.2 GRP1 binding protein [Loa loa]